MHWNSEIAVTLSFSKILSELELFLLILLSFSHLQWLSGMDRSNCMYLYKCTFALHIPVQHRNINISSYHNCYGSIKIFWLKNIKLVGLLLKLTSHLQEHKKIYVFIIAPAMASETFKTLLFVNIFIIFLYWLNWT